MSPKPIANIDDPRYVKALAHPLRVRILAILEERPASPVELSRMLGSNLGVVSYHVRTLFDLGLLCDGELQLLGQRVCDLLVRVREDPVEVLDDRDACAHVGEEHQHGRCS